MCRGMDRKIWHRKNGENWADLTVSGSSSAGSKLESELFLVVLDVSRHPGAKDQPWLREGF